MAHSTELAGTPDTARTEALLRLLRPDVRAQKAYLVGHPEGIDVKLNQNESPFDYPADLKAELAEWLRETPLNRYPDEHPYELIEALAEYNAVDPGGILVGNGSNELTYTLGLCFVQPGTPVVLPAPMFSLYTTMAKIYGGNLTTVGPRADLSFDVEAVLDAIERTQPALVVVTTPNNPTGLTVPMEDVERLVTAAPGFIVVDEAYVEFNPEGSARPLMDRYPNLILLRTLSKAFGLAGIRLGYLMAQPAVAQEMLKARLPFMVDRVAERAALLLLRQPERIRERVASMQASAGELSEALRGLRGVMHVVPSHANFCLFRTPLEAGAVVARLAEHGVLVRNMSGYPDLKGYVRVNAGTEAENQAFLAALKAALP